VSKNITKVSYSISAPIGAFGNHLRWLALLNNKFQLDFKLDVGDNLYKPFKTIDDKLEFILNYVYPTDRNTSNWLEYEWKYRRWFDRLIYFSHDEFIAKNNIFCIVNEDIAYEHYKKLNNTLNGFDEKDFKLCITEFNNLYSKRPNALQCDELVETTLSQRFYRKMCNKLSISESHYNIANEIHQRWSNIKK
jgi:hypothetical protein